MDILNSDNKNSTVDKIIKEETDNNIGWNMTHNVPKKVFVNGRSFCLDLACPDEIIKTTKILGNKFLFDAKPFIDITNALFSTVVFPQKMKHANVIPL